MKIKAIAPWFGAKRTIVKRIVEEIGRPKAFWDSMAGSLSVTLAMEPCQMETVNDLHGDVINLGRVLASDACKDLYARLQRTLMCDELFLEAKAICCETPCDVAPSIREVKPSHVERAFYYMILSWQGRNGAAGTGPGNLTPVRRYTSNGGPSGRRWLSAVESIPAWHQRLRAVDFMNVDAFDLLDRVEDKQGTVVYNDPPYIRKGAKYVYDFVQEVSIEEALADGGGEKEGKRNDHVRLAIHLRRFRKTRVIVSYYDEPELDLLYPGWTKRRLDVTKSLVNQGMRDRRGQIVKTPEVLLINGPSYVAERLLFD